MSRATIGGALVGLLVAVVAHRASYAGSIENPPPSEPEPLETSEPLDHFGNAMVFGDFDGDGVYDLAVGAYGESTGPANYTGAVLVFRGTDDGGFESWRLLSRFDAGFLRRSWDYFGHALAAGDYDGDGYDDLAIGAPGVDGTVGSSEGRVHIAWGSFAGLGVVETLSQSDAGAVPWGNAAFGYSLATGYFNGDEIADLAIGAVGAGQVEVSGTGHVFVMTGSEDGMQAWSSVHQATPQTAGIPGDTLSGDPLGTNEPADWFGWSLATGDLDQDGLDDLVVGAPGDKEGGADAGAVYVFLARPSAAKHVEGGMRGWLRLDQTGMDSNEQWDSFGRTVAIGNFKTSNWYTNEIIVGAPGEDLESSGADGAGWVYTFEVFNRRYVPLSDFGQSFLGDNGPADSFGSAMLVLHFDGRDFLLVSSPGDDRSGMSDVGEVLVFVATPTGPYHGGLPENPEVAWFYGKRAGQRFGRALAVDPGGQTVLMSSDDTTGSGVINDYMKGNQSVEGWFQETAVYPAP